MRVMTQGAPPGSLLDLLRRHDEIRRFGRPTLGSAPAQPGQMGSAQQWIELSLNAGFTLAALVVSIGAWLRPRKAREVDGKEVVVVIELNGTRVTMRSVDPEETARVLKELTASAPHVEP